MDEKRDVGASVAGRLVRSVASPEFTRSAPADVTLPAALAAQLEAAGAFVPTVEAPAEEDVKADAGDGLSDAEREAARVLGGDDKGDDKGDDMAEKDDKRGEQHPDPHASGGKVAKETAPAKGETAARHGKGKMERR